MRKTDDQFFFLGWLYCNHHQTTTSKRAIHLSTHRQLTSMTSYIPKTRPVNSEEFLPPANAKHKSGDDALLKEQAADREKIVCAVGIDVHYELNVVSNETGGYKPRLKPFNPRMCGPACPYPYTGKFIDETDHAAHQDDPVSLGRIIKNKDPYDKTLYAKRDPRLVSKCMVVRDYGCKIPIDLADTTKIAQAVLNHFPDQYVAFLGEFVSNLFGSSMRKFLDVQAKGLQRLLDRPEELNRISWAVYASVQGASSENPNWNTTDGTLVWKTQLDTALNKVADTGKTMSGQFSPNDVFNLRPCLEQHIETLTAMKNEWCRGFGSDETHVLCMLYYINECGRNWGDDLRLINDHGVPDYRQITLHVPVNLAYIKDSGHSTTISNPDQDASVRSNLRDVGRSLHHTDTLAISVGSWCGSGTNMFINTTEKANMSWGFGHCCNIAVRHGVKYMGGLAEPNNQVAVTHPEAFFLMDAHHFTMCQPHLPYKKNVNNHLHVDERGFGNSGQMSVTHVNEDKWGTAFDPENDGTVIQASTGKVTRGLRESLEEDDYVHPLRKTSYRGAANEPTFRAVATAKPLPMTTGTAVKTQAGTPDTTAVQTNHVKMSDVMKMTRGRHCDNVGGKFHVISNDKDKCEYINPFFAHAACFSSEGGDVTVENKAVGPYDIDHLTGSQTFQEIVRAAHLFPPTTLSCTVIQSLVANMKTTPLHLFGLSSVQGKSELLTYGINFLNKERKKLGLSYDATTVASHRLFHLACTRTSTQMRLPVTYAYEGPQSVGDMLVFMEDRILNTHGRSPQLRNAITTADGEMNDGRAIAEAIFANANMELGTRTISAARIGTSAADFAAIKAIEARLGSFRFLDNIPYMGYGKALGVGLNAPKIINGMNDASTLALDSTMYNLDVDGFIDMFSNTDPYLILSQQPKLKHRRPYKSHEFFTQNKVTPDTIMEDAEAYVYGVLALVKFLMTDDKVIGGTSAKIPRVQPLIDKYCKTSNYNKEQTAIVTAAIYVEMKRMHEDFAGDTPAAGVTAMTAATLQAAVDRLTNNANSLGMDSTAPFTLQDTRDLANLLTEINDTTHTSANTRHHQVTGTKDRRGDNNSGFTQKRDTLHFGVVPKHAADFLAGMTNKPFAAADRTHNRNNTTFADYFYLQFDEILENLNSSYDLDEPLLFLMYVQFTMYAAYDYHIDDADRISYGNGDALATAASLIRKSLGSAHNKAIEQALNTKKVLTPSVLNALDACVVLIKTAFGDNFSLLGANPSSFVAKHVLLAKYAACGVTARDTCDLNVSNAADYTEMRNTVHSLINAVTKDFNLDISPPHLDEDDTVRVYNAMAQWYNRPGRTFSHMDCASFLHDPAMSFLTLRRSSKTSPSRIRDDLLVEGYKGKIPFRLFLTPKVNLGTGDFFALLSGVDDRNKGTFTNNPFVVDLSKTKLDLSGTSTLAFPNVGNSLESIKLQLLLMKESLSASLGMYIAAAICEGTFLNAPYMQSLVANTGMELPGSEVKAETGSRNFVPSRSEDFPHTNLKVTYMNDDELKTFSKWTSLIQGDIDSGMIPFKAVNGDFKAYLMDAYERASGGKAQSAEFQQRWNAWWDKTSTVFPWATLKHDTPDSSGKTARETLAEKYSVLIPDDKKYFKTVATHLKEHLQYLKSFQGRFAVMNDKGVVDPLDVEYEFLKAHRDAVIRNYFTFANATNADRRRMVSTLLFRNIYHHVDDHKGYAYSFSTSQVGNPGASDKIKGYPTELAQLGRSQSYAGDHFVDLTLLYATDFADFEKQKREFAASLPSTFKQDVKNVVEEYVMYLKGHRDDGPFGSRENIFSDEIASGANPMVSVDEQGYPLMPLTQNGKTSQVALPRGRQHPVERIVDQAYTAFDKMWKERIRLTNIHTIMEEMKKVTMLDGRDGRVFRGTTEAKYRAGSLAENEYREYVTYVNSGLKLGQNKNNTKVYDFTPAASADFVHETTTNVPMPLGTLFDGDMTKNGSYNYREQNTTPAGDTEEDYPLVVDYIIYREALSKLVKDRDFRAMAATPNAFLNAIESEFSKAVTDAFDYTADMSAPASKWNTARKKYAHVAGVAATFDVTQEYANWVSPADQIGTAPNASGIEKRKKYLTKVVDTLKTSVQVGAGVDDLYIHPPDDTAVNRFYISRLSGDPSTFDADKVEANKDLLYNTSFERPQFFAMLDACAMLFNARTFYNPSDCNRGQYSSSHLGGVDDMHYWCRTLAESFLYARQTYRHENPHSAYEFAVKRDPDHAFPTRMIGALTDDSFAHMFPLLPKSSRIRDDLRRVRALNVLWGMTPGYRATWTTTAQGAWMPLSQYHTVELYKAAGLFDEKYNVPSNCWCAHNGNGISRVFNQSYHSVYHTDSYRAAHFSDWIKHACRYQPPRQGEGCHYPFSQYGGTPVQADFIHHRVEFPDPEVEKRHRQIVYNRFGITSPLRLGQQFHDKGILQDMYQPEYRPHADLSRDQRFMPRANEVWMSNFMSYARVHSIIALASCNHGTEEGSIPRIVRNLYRLYVDSYECMGADPEDDSIPCVMGFLPSAVNGSDDRPVVLYAGSLTCLNTKLEKFCTGDANRGERVCQIYKQVYLNDAAILYNRLSRSARRAVLHHSNFLRAQIKRGSNFTRQMFDQELIQLQDAYIEFLQQTCLGMLIESGASLNNVPLQLLEPRELEVSLFDEDTDVVGNDYLTPRTAEIIKDMDFSKDNLNRTQLAILSLIPPNHRILSTLRLSQNTEIIDLEHAKKQIQRETIDSNKKVWQRYTEALVSAAFAQKLLEVDGPIDLGFDMSAIKDPLKEAENIKTRMVSTHSQAASSISQTLRSDMLRSERGPESVMGMNTAEMERALQAVRDRVERDARRGTTRVQALERLRVPEHVKRMLRREYE